MICPIPQIDAGVNLSDKYDNEFHFSGQFDRSYTKIKQDAIRIEHGSESMPSLTLKNGSITCSINIIHLHLFHYCLFDCSIRFSIFVQQEKYFQTELEQV